MTANFDSIKREAEMTTSDRRLRDIERFSASRYMFLRFNFTTGDAAGQNMAGKATAQACTWIRRHYPGVRQFCLESNLATDKKSSQVNILDTRGKRATADATITPDLIREIMHTTPGGNVRARQVSNLGGMMAGSTTTATTRPTLSQRCSPRPARTSRTRPSRRPRSCMPSCSPTALITTRSPSRC